MRITDLLKPDAIRLDASVHTRDEAIDLLVDLHNQVGNLTDKAAYKQGILDREASGTTAIGDGIAIPHAKSAAVRTPGLAALTVPGGVDYQALDGQPTTLLFMIAAPQGGDLPLEVLSRLTVLLMDADFRQSLLSAGSVEDFLRRIDDKEAARFPDEPADSGGCRIRQNDPCLLSPPVMCG